MLPFLHILSILSILPLPWSYTREKCFTSEIRTHDDWHVNTSKQNPFDCTGRLRGKTRSNVCDTVIRINIKLNLKEPGLAIALLKRGSYLPWEGHTYGSPFQTLHSKSRPHLYKWNFHEYGVTSYLNKEMSRTIANEWLTTLEVQFGIEQDTHCWRHELSSMAAGH